MTTSTGIATAVDELRGHVRTLLESHKDLELALLAYRQSPGHASCTGSNRCAYCVLADAALRVRPTGTP